MWRLLQSYGLGTRAIALIAFLMIAALTLYYRFPNIHVDAIATILGLGIGIPGLLISVRLIFEAKSASVAARAAALATSRELESLEAYRRSAIAIGDLERLKTSLLNRQWPEARSELASILSQLRTVMNGGLEIEEQDEEGLGLSIKAFEIVEGRLADAIIKDQEPLNASGLVRSITKQLGFLSGFSGRLRKLTKKDDTYDG